MSITGQCLCGQVRYVVDGQPMMTAACHCRHCQRQSGTAFSIMIAVPSDAIALTGGLKIYADTADSGQELHRKFCPECGSPLFSVLVGAPAITFIKAGTLDDVSSLKPELQVWCKSAQPWVSLDPALPSFEGNPPMQTQSAELS